MWRRISMAGMALVATVVCYQVYELTLVPLIEPPVVQSNYDPASEEQWSSGQESLKRYQQLLSHYFPANHWSLNSTPKIIENGQVMLVLEDYQPDERGGVQLKNCAIISFPTPRATGEAPPTDAVIIEAPGGANLQFDEAFNPTRGKIGRLLNAYFPGELVIRSQMSKPGPEDDLFIRTSELRLKENLLYTDSEIQFRFGLHNGSGRQLEIRLLKEEHLKPGETGLEIAGIASLEIREAVQMQIALEKGMDSFDGGVLGSSKNNAPSVSNDVTPKMLTIKSGGSFRFDFMRFMASFQQQVQATIPRDDGPNDRLDCEELRLYFSDKQGNLAMLTPADEPELAKRQGDLLGSLQPYLLEATGNPFRLNSPATESLAHGRKLQAWLGDRRLRIEGQPATLANAGNEIQSAWIDYRAPPEDALSPIGDLAMAGPGWLRVMPEKDQPLRAIEARWKAPSTPGPAVVLQRNESGQPVLTIEGRPEVASSTLGRIVADSFSIQLREVAPDGPEGPAIELGPTKEGRESIAILPERIDANGSIEFRGRELTGRTNSLVAWLRPMEATPEQKPSRFSSSNQDNESPARKSYVLSAEHVQIDVGLFGQKAEPTGLLCTSNVRFEEATRNGEQAPLRVLGDQLRVDGLHEEGIRLTVAGLVDGETRATASGGSERRGLAQITGKGIRLWAKELHADQLRNRVWIDGPGDARIDLKTRSTSPRLSTLQGEATIRWTGGLEFDGSQIELRDEVFAETADGWLRCDRMAARLSQPIDLMQGSKRLGKEIEIAEVECFNGVTIDYRTADLQGERSRQRARLKTLKINQLTGAISGQGPGSIRSVHLTDKNFANLTGSQQPTTGSSKSSLNFLRVNFQRGITGNIDARAVQFHERVRGVYGPVLAWDQEIAINSPHALPPDVVAIECNELRVYEDPNARLLAQRTAVSRNGKPTDAPIGPLELRALGAVRLEGSSGDDKPTKFTAEATSASYTQLKEVFVLEGNAQRGVSIWVQQDPNRPPAQSVAGKITYDIKKKKIVKIEDIRSVDYRTAQPRSRSAR